MKKFLFIIILFIATPSQSELQKAPPAIQSASKARTTSSTQNTLLKMKSAASNFLTKFSGSKAQEKSLITEAPTSLDLSDLTTYTDNPLRANRASLQATSPQTLTLKNQSQIAQKKQEFEQDNTEINNALAKLKQSNPHLSDIQLNQKLQEQYNTTSSKLTDLNLQRTIARRLDILKQRNTFPTQTDIAQDIIEDDLQKPTIQDTLKQNLNTINQALNSGIQAILATTTNIIASLASKLKIPLSPQEQAEISTQVAQKNNIVAQSKLITQKAEQFFANCLDAIKSKQDKLHSYQTTINNDGSKTVTMASKSGSMQNIIKKTISKDGSEVTEVSTYDVEYDGPEKPLKKTLKNSYTTITDSHGNYTIKNSQGTLQERYIKNKDNSAIRIKYDKNGNPISTTIQDNNGNYEIQNNKGIVIKKHQLIPEAGKDNLTKMTTITIEYDEQTGKQTSKKTYKSNNDYEIEGQEGKLVETAKIDPTTNARIVTRYTKDSKSIESKTIQNNDGSIRIESENGQPIEAFKKGDKPGSTILTKYDQNGKILSTNYSDIYGNYRIENEHGAVIETYKIDDLTKNRTTTKYDAQGKPTNAQITTPAGQLIEESVYNPHTGLTTQTKYKENGTIIEKTETDSRGNPIKIYKETPYSTSTVIINPDQTFTNTTILKSSGRGTKQLVKSDGTVISQEYITPSQVKTA